MIRGTSASQPMTLAADPLSSAFWPEPLRRAFYRIPAQTPWVVALSGGLDSVVLLHLALRWRQAGPGAGPLRALHINHGLALQASEWAAHCRALCARLGVELEVAQAHVGSAAGVGLEDAARQARYGIFEDYLAAGEVLLLAHHADDQAETQLYRMMRGAGLTGLAGMPETRSLGRGSLYRPLLSLSRHNLEALARSAQLEWVEDPSNRDDRYDRNFLRGRIMPLLRERWPGVSARMARNAQHVRESLALLEERARDDALLVVDTQNGDLKLAHLQALSGPRRRNLVQWWLRELGLAPLSEAHLTAALDQFLSSADDKNPVIAWDGQVLRRYAGRVVVLAGTRVAVSPESATWALSEPLQWAGGTLAANPSGGGGLAGEIECLHVSTRQGGELIELATGQHQALKKWLQARQIPPWERAVIPLLWSGSTLVAIADQWLHPRFLAPHDKPGWNLSWQPPEFRAGSWRGLSHKLEAYSD